MKSDILSDDLEKMNLNTNYSIYTTYFEFIKILLNFS